MQLSNWFLRLLFSQRGEGEGEAAGGQGEGSAEGQGDPNASAVAIDGQQQGQQQSQQGQEPTLAEVMAQLTEIKGQYETLKGQSGATERNLAAERKALEAMGLKAVRDSQGNVQMVPLNQSVNKSRFSDDHKNKFFSYFPDQNSGQGFLELMNLYLQDFFDSNIQHYDRNVSQKQQFVEMRQEAIGRMHQLFPSLNQSDASFNKAFYDKANELYQSRYANLPNGDLIAANEAAVEMGIAPAAVAQAKKEGFQKAQQQRKIVGVAQGGQAPAGQGFRKLSFEEYKGLSPEQRSEYDRKEIENRKK